MPTDTKVFFLHLLNSVDSLFLWIPNIVGRSLGCRWRRTGVPIRSWGRYPRRGTALMHRKIRKIPSNQSYCPLTVWWFACEHSKEEKKKTCRHGLPLIHILKHTTRSVCGGEDAFVCWNSGCFKEERRIESIKSNTEQKKKDFNANCGTGRTYNDLYVSLSYCCTYYLLQCNIISHGP